MLIWNFIVDNKVITEDYPTIYQLTLTHKTPATAY